MPSLSARRNVAILDSDTWRWSNDGSDLRQVSLVNDSDATRPIITPESISHHGRSSGDRVCVSIGRRAITTNGST